MARLKPQTKKLSSLDEVNAAIMDIAALEMQLQNIDASASERIALIKKATAQEGEAARERIANLSHMIGAFAEYNKDELFKDKKSIMLAFGEFGYRKSTTISVKKTTVDHLKQRGLTQYLHMKETPNKDALRELDDATLADIDAVRKVEDKFFVEPNHEKINQDLLARELA